MFLSFPVVSLPSLEHCSRGFCQQQRKSPVTSTGIPVPHALDQGPPAWSQQCGGKQVPHSSVAGPRDTYQRAILKQDSGAERGCQGRGVIAESGKPRCVLGWATEPAKGGDSVTWSGWTWSLGCENVTSQSSQGQKGKQKGKTWAEEARGPLPGGSCAPPSA